jgi:hypothetical protein
MKITLKKHPELKLAHKLLQLFPDAIIAGGVVRDLINGKAFKDVDFFIPAPSSFELAKISISIGRFAAELKKEETLLEDSYEIATGGPIRISIENLDICILPNNFTAESLVSTFDTVSSQAWLEPVKGGFEAKATELFYELNEKKVLGFYEAIAGSCQHIERVKEKYPDYLPLSLKQPILKQPVDDGFDDISF